MVSCSLPGCCFLNIRQLWWNSYKTLVGLHSLNGTEKGSKGKYSSFYSVLCFFFPSWFTVVFILMLMPDQGCLVKPHSAPVLQTSHSGVHLTTSQHGFKEKHHLMVLTCGKDSWVWMRSKFWGQRLSGPNAPKTQIVFEKCKYKSTNRKKESWKFEFLGKPKRTFGFHIDSGSKLGFSQSWIRNVSRSYTEEFCFLTWTL